MSFKDRVIEYCECKQRKDCRKCALKGACDRVHENMMPRVFTDAEFDRMKVYLWELIKKLSEQYLEAVTVLFDLKGGQHE